MAKKEKDLHKEMKKDKKRERKTTIGGANPYFSTAKMQFNDYVEDEEFTMFGDGEQTYRFTIAAVTNMKATVTDMSFNENMVDTCSRHCSNF